MSRSSRNHPSANAGNSIEMFDLSQLVHLIAILGSKGLKLPTRHDQRLRWLSTNVLRMWNEPKQRRRIHGDGESAPRRQNALEKCSSSSPPDIYQQVRTSLEPTSLSDRSLSPASSWTPNGRRCSPSPTWRSVKRESGSAAFALLTDEEKRARTLLRSLELCHCLEKFRQRSRWIRFFHWSFCANLHCSHTGKTLLRWESRDEYTSYTSKWSFFLVDRRTPPLHPISSL